MRTLHGIDVERVRAFADAVFAIAITLLALEIRIPEDLPADELGHGLREALPSVAGYLLSFLVVGSLWVSHHRLFHMAKALDGPLLYLDLALMALVAVLPFPTKIITTYHDSAIATSLYAGTITLSALLITAMAVRLLRHPALCNPETPRSLITQSLHYAAGAAVIFGSSVPVALISPSAAEYWWVALAVPFRIYLAWHHGRSARHAAPTPAPAP
ncbi:TMEM175 family protein [Streptomyces sp. TS71-3]|uniref:TMEM175 family protein n=1 Tax=Streptomyces sp. TS71-3 TaxID=2733862 RepID=UPI001B069BD5|nr:TMEM175 family protein [Streptomyces sp. TS71-3]GHJ37148.1 DUF1211 domain-containing membrane protein [Streptomyces sp. TS71-3]